MNDALDQYRRRAGVYDLELAAFEPIRCSAIARLKLKRGAAVLDVGCGTGLSFCVLQQAIGRRGRIVAIEQCDALQAAVETAPIPCRVDAAVFHFTHDILRNPEAVRNVVDHLKPGATVVAAGLQWAPRWNWAVNCFVMGAALHSVTSLEGLDQPWSLLAEHIGAMQASTELWGGAYIASGVYSR